MLITKRGRFNRQPQQPVFIDRKNTIAARLAYLAIANDAGKVRDIVSGSTVANPGSAAAVSTSQIWTFNGSQQGNFALAIPAVGSMLVCARIRASAAQAGNPGGAFGVFKSSAQSGFGVGFNSSNQVGLGWLSTAGAGITAYSSASLNTWYDVYCSMSSSFSARAWINGQPATTGQGTSITNFVNAQNEIAIGAQHRSSGFLRQFKGDIEWVSILEIDDSLVDDDLAAKMFASGFPYSYLRSPDRRIFIPVGGGSSVSLTIADSSHAHTSETFGLTVADYLAIADSTHAHASDNIVIDTSSAANLTIADAQHAHSAESLTLVTDSLLAIADSVHVHQSENLSLSSAVFLAIADAVHAHLSDNVTLDTSNAITLTVQDSAHGHTSESLGLTLDTWLQIVDSLHAHLSDSVVLSAEETLSIANALHAHFSAVPTLILGGAVVYARAPSGGGPRILAAPGRRPANMQTQSRPVNTGGTRH